jgi:hypothetical protein
MTELLCIAGTVLFGFAAYRFRRRNRFWFGVGEIIVAFFQIHLAWLPTYDFRRMTFSSRKERADLPN